MYCMSPWWRDICARAHFERKPLTSVRQAGVWDVQVTCRWYGPFKGCLTKSNTRFLQAWIWEIYKNKYEQLCLRSVAYKVFTSNWGIYILSGPQAIIIRQWILLTVVIHFLVNLKTFTTVFVKYQSTDFHRAEEIPLTSATSRPKFYLWNTVTFLTWL